MFFSKSTQKVMPNPVQLRRGLFDHEPAYRTGNPLLESELSDRPQLHISALMLSRLSCSNGAIMMLFWDADPSHNVAIVIPNSTPDQVRAAAEFVTPNGMRYNWLTDMPVEQIGGVTVVEINLTAPNGWSRSVLVDRGPGVALKSSHNIRRRS